jgi:signal peptidase I
MRSQGGRLAAGLAALAVLATFWLYLAPIQVGGAATYSITAGNSMEPLLHKDNLALVRSQSTYKVGDVVLYQSSVLNEPVLHRIIVIQDGHYFFKGDNNGFVDPGYATRSELVGKLWLHVPVVGGVLGWIGKPWHATLIAAITTMFLLLGGVTSRSRRHRRRGPVTARPRPQPDRRQARALTARYMMPMSRATLAALAVLVALGLLMVAIGFTTPRDRFVEQAGAYSHEGAFAYRAQLIKPNSAYPAGVIVTGQPLFTNLVNSTTLTFDYRFVSKLPHRVHGTIELKALILSQSSGWQNLYAVEKRTAFTGDTARTGGPVTLKSLYALLDQLATASGVATSEYSIDIQPVVHLVGTVGGKSVDTTFSPVLPFSVTATEVRLDVATSAIVPGATSTPPTQQDALSATINPVQSGSIPKRAANEVTIARYPIPVIALRIAGLLALALALALAVLHDRLLRRGSQRPIEEQIAAHFGCLVAPVDARVVPEGSASTPVHDFTSLAQLAGYLERPILRYTDESGRIYAVDDETRVYEYHAEPFRPTPERRAPPVPKLRVRGAVGHPSRVTIAAACVALLIAITLVTSFTAKTNVPTSNIGASSVPGAVSQGAPAGCSALASSLTSLVTHSGNFTNTASHALVLGTSGVNVITDNGRYNCIVGGGGKDTINGDSTDICIVGPTSGASYRTCTKQN